MFLRDRLQTAALAAYGPVREFHLAAPGGAAPAQAVDGSEVSANFFRVLGVEPALGRSFAAGADQPSHGREVVLSHRLWVRAFHADPAVVGRSIAVDGAARAVVGVMAAGFRPLNPGVQLWMPLSLDATARGVYWYGSYMPVLGRLRPGVTRRQANAELSTLEQPLAAAIPGHLPPTTFGGSSLLPLRSITVGDIGSNLWLLLGAVGLLLLIACVNVANLLRARAASRSREMALRSAIGPGWPR
ncbi:MAG: ABC transporter permease [Terriglobales bacterium]